MVKKVLIAIAGLVVLLIAIVTVAAFVTTTELKAEREIVINKPRAEVYEYVRHLKNQNQWGTWYKRDPAMKQEFRGTDGSVGFTSAWSSTNDEVGEGEQEIKRLVPDERMETELRFKKPFESKSDSYLTLESVAPDKTKVKWGFTGSMPRPLNLMCLVVDMDAMIGKDFEDGLANLKPILESR